jgi:hypothetical protein
MASSMSSPAPPGGPAHPDFHNAISELAALARKEDFEAADDARRKANERPLSRFIRFGCVLIAIQVVCLGVLYIRGRGLVSPAATKQANIVLRDDCPSAVYRTYWKVIEYMKEHQQPPASIDELVGKYLDKLPADPVSGKPLQYSTDGKHFELHCPGARGSRPDR